MIERSIDDYYYNVSVSNHTDEELAVKIAESVEIFGREKVVSYFNGRHSNLTISLAAKGVTNLFSRTLPLQIVSSGYNNALIALIKAGYNINEKIANLNHPTADPVNLLLFAVSNHHYETAKLLLENGIAADVHMSTVNYNLLHLAKEKRMMRLIAEHAIIQKCLHKMAIEKDNPNSEIPLQRLMDFDLIVEVVSCVNSLLDSKDPTVLNYEDWRPIYNWLANNILSKKLDNIEESIACLKRIGLIIGTLDPSLLKAIPIPTQSRTDEIFENDVQTKSIELFGKIYDMQTAHHQEDALKGVLAQIAALFLDPAKCMSILKYINNHLEKYYEAKTGKSLPLVERHNFKFITINGHVFPIPKYGTDYLKPTSTGKVMGGLEKSSSLKELLLLVFKENGLSENVIKWVGFVISESANATVRDGNVVLESLSTGATALHGAYSHMLQVCVFLLAIKLGMINTRYRDLMGNEQVITPKMIMQGLVDLKVKDNNAWVFIMDWFDVGSDVTFSDPYRVSSAIMTNGDMCDMKTLSSYLIDSCVKGLINFYNGAAKHNLEIGDFYNFIELLVPYEIRLISVLPEQTHNALNKYRLQYGEARVKMPSATSGIVEPNYKPLIQDKFTLDHVEPIKIHLTIDALENKTPQALKATLSDTDLINANLFIEAFKNKDQQKMELLCNNGLSLIDANGVYSVKCSGGMLHDLISDDAFNDSHNAIFSFLINFLDVNQRDEYGLTPMAHNMLSVIELGVSPAKTLLLLSKKADITVAFTNDVLNAYGAYYLFPKQNSKFTILDYIVSFSDRIDYSMIQKFMEHYTSSAILHEETRMKLVELAQSHNDTYTLNLVRSSYSTHSSLFKRNLDNQKTKNTNNPNVNNDVAPKKRTLN